MNQYLPVERVVNLLDPQNNQILNMTCEQATELLASGEPERLKSIDGHFALFHKQGQLIRMARSLGRPMRYFLAKRAVGPCLVVAERMDEIHQFLKSENLDDQFHPTYTRMVPAHHLIELKLIGCPDPNPVHQRFFDPQRNQLSTDLDEIGKRYIQTLSDQCNLWLDQIDSQEPVGVLFSGGIDSGAVLLVLYDLLLKRGEAPSRLKAFTLQVGEQGSDSTQAAKFVNQLDLSYLLEVITVAPEAINYQEAIRVIEDYKPLDVQAAAMGHALCQAIRKQYESWTWLIDGDGGDENLKDYPIEENPELTIRSVLNNSMLYQEGWGVDAVKHSLTYSGGQSRGHVRSWAPAQLLGFRGFSPFALPKVIEVAEGIPFIELTDWDHQRLYDLKGEIVKRGIAAVTGLQMPVFEKQRFQKGAGGEAMYQQLFPENEIAYRKAFDEIYA